MTRSDAGVVQPDTVTIGSRLDRTLAQFDLTLGCEMTVLVPLADHQLVVVAVPHLEVDVRGDIELGVGCNLRIRRCTQAGTDVLEVVVHGLVVGAALDALDPVLAVLSELSDGGDHDVALLLVGDDDWLDLGSPLDHGEIQEPTLPHVCVLPAQIGNLITSLIGDGAIPTQRVTQALTVVDHVITHFISLLWGMC